MLAIVGGAAQLEFRDSESEVWRTRLQASSAHAAARGGRRRPHRRDRPAGRAVRRHGLARGKGHDRDESSRGAGIRAARPRPLHVQEGARLSADRRVDRFSRRSRPDRSSSRSRSSEILHIEDDDGPDFALLRVGESRGQALAPPIPLSTSPPQAKQQVAVIGYPARDSRAPDAQLVQSIFGDVLRQEAARAGSGDGSESGRPAPRLFDAWRELGFGRARSGDRATPLDCTSPAAFSKPTTPCRRRSLRSASNRVRHPKPGKPTSRPPQGPVSPPAIVTPTPDAGTPASYEVFVEGVPADYVGRTGYDPRFVGVDVPLPVVAQRGRRPHVPLGWCARNRSSSTSTSRW